MSENNYFPEREKEIQIPSFLANKNEEGEFDMAAETQQALNEAVAIGEAERLNGYHLKELDKQADNYHEDEARTVVKRLVSNYPDIVLEEVSSLIKDMQELSGVILKNSSAFAKKRGEM